MANHNEAVALYWDFENLHASLVDELFGLGSYAANRFRPQDELIDVAAINEFALSLGPVAINRAFANWVSFNRYKQSLLQSAIELIQVFPPGANAKNGADIKLCLDAMDDMARFPHISTIIVVGGDSDYMPLSYKVKAAGRTLIGIGSRRTTNQHWARSCHEFKFYQALVEPPPAVVEATPGPGDPAPAVASLFATAPAVPGPEAVDPASNDSEISTAPADVIELVAGTATVSEQRDEGNNPAPPAEQARELVTKALGGLIRARGEAWIAKARLRPYVQRMDPTFHESTFGFATFNELLASMTDLVESRRGEHDHELRLRPAALAVSKATVA